MNKRQEFCAAVALALFATFAVAFAQGAISPHTIDAFLPARPVSTELAAVLGWIHGVPQDTAAITKRSTIYASMLTNVEIAELAKYFARHGVDESTFANLLGDPARAHAAYATVTVRATK